MLYNVLRILSKKIWCMLVLNTFYLHIILIGKYIDLPNIFIGKLPVIKQKLFAQVLSACLYIICSWIWLLFHKY
jgi:hypothetical protein